MLVTRQTDAQMTQAGETQGRETVDEAVAHGSVVEGPRCSERS